VLTASPHPALRVPVLGDGAAAGDWAAVATTPEGVPILIADADAYLARVGDDAYASLDALSFDALAHLARYLPTVLEADAPMRLAVRETVARFAPANAALGVEFGSSVGPDLPALRAVCSAAIAVEGSVAAARVAAELVAGRPVPRLQRVEGRSFTALAPVTRAPLSDVTVVVGDALDPPLHPGTADVVVALNLLDNVVSPLDLVGQLDAVLRPGGLLLLASPFCWQDALTPADAQLGGSTVPALAALGSPAALTALLRGEAPVLTHLAYDVLHTADVPWRLRDHARAEFHYLSWLVAARKR